MRRAMVEMEEGEGGTDVRRKMPWEERVRRARCKEEGRVRKEV
jgi:hypothetical protein